MCAIHFEVFFGLILDTIVLDESSVVVSTVLAGDPTELVDVAGGVERACRLELVPESSHFRLELVQTHPIGGVLQPGVFTTVGYRGLEPYDK